MARSAIARTPAPISTPISDYDRLGKMTGYVPVPWSDYFNGVDAQLAGSYAVLDHQQVPSGSTSLPSTPIAADVLAEGLYRVSYYLVVLQAATTSSSVSVTIGWRDRGVTRQQTSPALNLNTTQQAFSNVFMVRIDYATAPTYSVTYASVGAQPMLYGLDVLFEQVLVLP